MDPVIIIPLFSIGGGGGDLWCLVRCVLPWVSHQTLFGWGGRDLLDVGLLFENSMGKKQKTLVSAGGICLRVQACVARGFWSGKVTSFGVLGVAVGLMLGSVFSVAGLGGTGGAEPAVPHLTEAAVLSSL